MSKISKKIVFFGNERLATGVTTSAPTIQALIAANYTIAAVIANYEVGQSRNSRQLEIAKVADDNHIELLLPNRLVDIKEQLRTYNADIGVLVAYGKIVPKEIIDIFPHGIINIHPSLLPGHRGPTPIESVIVNGETATGVSLMKLVPQMDAGPVYGFSEYSVRGNESKQFLSDTLLNIGSSLLIELLPAILGNTTTAIAQDETRATYDSKINKEDGRLDWQKPAAQLERNIKAYAGWPKSYTTLGDIEVVITAAHSVPSASERPGTIEIDHETGLVMIHCKDGYLCIDSLIPAGKKEMPVRAFLAGYKNRLIT